MNGCKPQQAMARFDAAVSCRHRRTWLKLPLPLFAMVLCGRARAQATLARDQSVMGWDLTYQRLIRETGIKAPNFLITWSARIRDQFAPGLLLEYEGKPLIAAFLVEHAFDGHAGNPIGVWAGRTSEKAFAQQFVLGRRSKPVDQLRVLDAAHFDRTLEALMRWKPTPVPNAPPGLDPHSDEVLSYSHLGVVSVFRSGTSRQWPIVERDLWVLDSARNVEPPLGRLNKILFELVPPDGAATFDPAVAEQNRQRAIEAHLQKSVALILGARLQSLDGAAVSLHDQSGKILVVSLIATWCKPCEAWAKVLGSLNDEFAARNVVVVAISDEEANKVRAFHTQHGSTYPLFLTSRQDNVFFAAQTTGLPTTYVIDTAGKPHGPFVGAAEAQVHALLKDLADSAPK